MSEHHEDFPPASEPDSAPFKDDDFPGDFFDDTNEPATFDAEPMETAHSFESHDGGTATATIAEPAVAKPPRRVLVSKIATPEPVPTPGGLIPWTLAVAAFAGVGIAALFVMKPNEQGGDAVAAAAVATPAPKAETPAPTPTETVAAAPTVPTPAAETKTEAPKAETPAPTPAPAETVATAPTPTPSPEPVPASAPAPVPSAVNEALLADLKAVKETLTAEIKAVSDKVEALPKPEPVDLKAIETKLADDTKAIEALAPLGDKVSKVEESVTGFDSAIKSIQGEIAGLKDELKKTGEAITALTAAMTKAPAAPAAVPTATAAAPADLGGFDAAAAALKAGKYADADAAFEKLAAADPKDARIFYFAALANGSAKNIWDGETVTLVNKGIDLEKAGTPKKEEIDAATADLITPLKTWIDAYRKRVGQ